MAFALVAATCALLAPSAVAGGAHGVFVAGAYTVPDFGMTDCTPLDDTHLRCSTTALKSDYTGDLTGTTRADFKQTIDCAAGRARGHGVETFTGSLDGGPAGTLTWRLYFTSDVDCATLAPTNLRIIAIVKRGTGRLAGLRGVLLFDDTTYRGVLS